MKLTPIVRRCGFSWCPEIYATDHDTYVIQGTLVNCTDVDGGLEKPDYEALVEVPKELLEDFVARLVSGEGGTAAKSAQASLRSNKHAQET